MQSSCLRGWIRCPQMLQGSPLGTRFTPSSSSHVNLVLSTATGIHSSSKMPLRTCRSISFTGNILPSAFMHLPATSRPTRSPISRLAEKYKLRTLYKKEFHDVFQEFHEHADFRPLLQKMKVVDENGETEMNEDQWEAASTSSAASSVLC